MCGWRTKLYIIPIVLFSILYNIPKFFELRVGMSNSTDIITAEEINLLPDTENEIILMTKQNKYHIEPTALRVHHLYVHIYLIYTNIIVNGELHYWDYYSKFIIIFIFSRFGSLYIASWTKCSNLSENLWIARWQYYYFKNCNITATRNQIQSDIHCYCYW